MPDACHLLERISADQWNLIHAKLRSAQLQLRITADQAFDRGDYWTQKEAEATMDDLADLAATI